MANGVSIESLVDAGLKASRLRSGAIANNVANLNTPGYRRIGVRFEELLKDLLAGGDQNGLDLAQALPELFRPGTTPVGENGNDVDLDAEIGELVKNGLKQKTMFRLLARNYRQMELAMQDR